MTDPTQPADPANSVASVIANEEEKVAAEIAALRPSFFSSNVFQWGMLALLIIIALFLYVRHLNEPDPAPVGLQVIATPAKELKAIPKVMAHIKNGVVRVYASPAKVKLKLPEAVAADPDVQVFASSQVKADEHPQTITTTINTATGEPQTFTRRDPLPWLAWDDRGALGMYAGIKSGGPAVRLEAKQQIFAIKALHFGAVATIDQPFTPSATSKTDYFVGVGAEYHW